MSLSFDQYLNDLRNTPIKHKPILSFLGFPTEIINLIIYHFTEGEFNLNFSPLSKSEGNNPDYTLTLNHIRCGHKIYSDLLALSSTCSYLRIYLGPSLFKNVSLIRENQVDAIMAAPKSSELFSDKRSIHRQFVKEMVEVNFGCCSLGELARSGFRKGVFGDINYRSRFQTEIALTNFVTYLECDNWTLQNRVLAYFPNLKAIKVLDTAFPGECCEERVHHPLSPAINALAVDPVQVLTEATKELEREQNTELAKSFRDLKYLHFLSVHANTLTFVKGLSTVVSRVKRLDLVVELAQITRQNGIGRLRHCFLGNDYELEELNLFIDCPYALIYENILCLLSEISSSCPKLAGLAIRKTRRNVNNDEVEMYVSNEGYSGIKFVRVLSNMHNLQNLTVDLQMLGALAFPENVIMLNPAYREFNSKRSHAVRCLTIIDASMTTPKLPHKLRNITAFLVQSLNINELAFLYGEVIEQAHVLALDVVTNLVEFLTTPYSTVKYYQGVERVSTEKCWSVSDDTMRREYYDMSIMDLLKITTRPGNLYYLKLKVTSASLSGRIAFNSPRYRVRESYNVSYPMVTLRNYLQSLPFPPADPDLRFFSSPEMEDLIVQPQYKSTTDECRGYGSSRAFWSLETSLSELEQYCLTPKKASQLWQ